MSTIQPVNFPIYGEATRLEVTVLSFQTSATSAPTYWRLLTDQGIQCAEGNYHMTTEQFSSWGQDNSVVDGYVAQSLGLVIITQAVQQNEPSIQ